MSKISRRKLKNLLKQNVEIFPEPDESLITKLQNSIPKEYGANTKKIWLQIKLGFAAVIIVLIIYSIVSISNKNFNHRSEKFKPTKIIVLDYPSFEPTKIVEITSADKIE